MPIKEKVLNQSSSPLRLLNRSRMIQIALAFFLFTSRCCATTSSTQTTTSLPNPPQKITPCFAFPDIKTSTLLAQTASVAATYLSLITYVDRPRGKLTIDPSALICQKSNVEGAGLGLFAAQSLPAGTVLGTYPGVLRPTSKYFVKYQNYPESQGYTWRLHKTDEIIDPTDRQGRIGDVCYGGSDDYIGSYFLHEVLLKFWSVPTLLARINEPPLGVGGCSVETTVDDDKREVVFSLVRDVYEGEELYLDYGPLYDRTGYQ